MSLPAKKPGLTSLPQVELKREPLQSPLTVLPVADLFDRLETHLRYGDRDARTIRSRMVSHAANRHPTLGEAEAAPAMPRYGAGRSAGFVLSRSLGPAGCGCRRGAIRLFSRISRSAAH